MALQRSNFQILFQLILSKFAVPETGYMYLQNCVSHLCKMDSDQCFTHWKIQKYQHHTTLTYSRFTLKNHSLYNCVLPDYHLELQILFPRHWNFGKCYLLSKFLIYKIILLFATHLISVYIIKNQETTLNLLKLWLLPIKSISSL